MGSNPYNPDGAEESFQVAIDVGTHGPYEFGDFLSQFKKLQEEAQQSMMGLVKGELGLFRRDLKEQMTNILVEVKSMKEKMASQEQTIAQLKDRIEILENRKEDGGKISNGEEMFSVQVEETVQKMKRACQIRVTGLEEKEGETHSGLRKLVGELFEEKMKVEGGSHLVTDVFRIGRKGEDRSGRSRVVIVRVGSMGQRNEILRGKKNLGSWKAIGVDVDRTKEELEEWKKELKKKREIEGRGGRVVWVKGKAVQVGTGAVASEGHGGAATMAGKVASGGQEGTATTTAGTPLQEENEEEGTPLVTYRRSNRIHRGVTT
jgi:hypothetical protein